jgi:hypothetical protein
MSRIVKGIFGGSSKSEQIIRKFQPVGFSTPGGLSADFVPSGTGGGGSFNLTRGEETNQAISALVGSGVEARRGFSRLRGQVRPGFGRLTQSRVEAIRGAGERTVGNLREELSRRRVAGSSFAQREIASTEAEFGRLEEQSRAEALIQEIGLTGQLIGQEFQSALQTILPILKQLNIESSIAAGLATNASAQINANLVAQGEAQAAQQAAGEDFLGTIAGLIFG